MTGNRRNTNLPEGERGNSLGKLFSIAGLAAEYNSVFHRSYFLINAMGALMLLQAAKAFFVAANTAVNLLDLPGGHFVRPFRVNEHMAELRSHVGRGSAEE